MAYVRNIDDAIALYLNREKVTIKAFSEKLDMTPETLANKRSGAFDWKFSEVIKISEITGVSVSSLAS